MTFEGCFALRSLRLQSPVPIHTCVYLNLFLNRLTFICEESICGLFRTHICNSVMKAGRDDRLRLSYTLSARQEAMCMVLLLANNRQVLTHRPGDRIPRR